MSFPEAVTRLLGEQGEIIYKTADIKEQGRRKPFVLPQKNSDMRRSFAYLIKQRHIDRDIIGFFARKKMLYESCELSKDKTKEYHNAVFVGIDENGIPRHGHKQGLYTKGKKFKGNIESSDPCYSFNYIGRAISFMYLKHQLICFPLLQCIRRIGSMTAMCHYVEYLNKRC